MHPYFTDLAAALSREKKADQTSFQEKFQQKSLQERRLTGLLWHPLVIKQVDPTWGDYILVTVERPKFQEIPSGWKAGMAVQLYSLAEPDEKPIEGTWQRGAGNQGVVFFKCEALPDWTRQGKLVLEALFDHHAYTVMEEAMHYANQKIEESEVIRYLISPESCEFQGHSQPLALGDGVNPSQQQAIQAMVGDDPIVAIQGPPGTGKTTTLVEGIRYLQGKTWVCAPSHTAVDVITSRLVAAGVKVVRVGLPERMTPDLWAVSLDRLIEVHPTNQQVKKIRKQAREYKRMGHQYKRSFGASERNQRKLLFEEAASQDQWARDLEKTIVQEILATHTVVTGTLVGIRQIFPWMPQADHLVIDEAGQSLEPACWVTIPRAKRVIFAGDPKQLPPTVFDPASGLDNTLLSKIMVRLPYHLLNIQYRMHPQIAEFASRHFYESKLTSGDHWVRWSDNRPFRWIDTAGAGFDEKSQGTSWINPEEAQWIFNQMKVYQQENPSSKQVVIAPYKAQVLYFQDLIRQENVSIQASTIDGFQGQEQEIIWISLTRSNATGSIGFLVDLRRIHVAMTRAQKQLNVVGDSATWGQHDFFSQILDYVEGIDGYQTVWELTN